MQTDILNIIFVLAAFLGIMLFISLSFSVNSTHSGKILGAFILCMTLFTIHNLLLEYGLMRQVPRLFRITKPLNYALPVFVYLYVRSHVYNELKFRRTDWMFFIPAILHGIELVPFYMMPFANKQNYVEAFYANMNSGLQHTEGILPPYVHPALITILATIMYFLSVNLLAKARKDSSRFSDMQNKLQIKWLNFFVGINILFLLILIFHLLTWKFFHINTYLLNNVEGAGMLLCIGVALFFNPGILYGFRGAPLVLEPSDPGVVDQVNQNSNTGKAAKAFVLSDDRRKEFLQKITAHFAAIRPYINQGYSIQMLSEELDIPYSYLSQVINQEYGMNFNEFINSYRVSYVKELLMEPDAHQYTFEALSARAGFSSRSTFSRAFSHFTGCTPSEFVKNASQSG